MIITFETDSRHPIPRYRSRELLQTRLADALERMADRAPNGANPDRAEWRAARLFRPGPSYDRGAILREAENHRSRGSIRKAIREYERVLAVDPQDAEVHAEIGEVEGQHGEQIYQRQGRHREAQPAPHGHSLAPGVPHPALSQGERVLKGIRVQRPTRQEYRVEMLSTDAIQRPIYPVRPAFHVVLESPDFSVMGSDDHCLGPSLIERLPGLDKLGLFKIVRYENCHPYAIERSLSHVNLLSRKPF